LLKCGSCRTEFLLSDICVFIQHKTSSCKLYEPKKSENLSPNDLLCGTCPEKFYDARSLLEHAQYTHKINIFVNSDPSPSPSSTNTKLLPSSNTTSTTSTTTSNIELPTNKKNSTNEIFIDFVQSDKRSDNRYNITVSSSSNNNNGNNNNNSMEHDQENNINTSIMNNSNNNNKTIINMSPKKKLLSCSYNNLAKNSIDDDSNGKVKIEMKNNQKGDEKNQTQEPNTSNNSLTNNSFLSANNLNSDNGNCK
jgi:hypothetical protein